MNKVRLAIVGVGNCASSLVQGLEYYKEADPETRVPGLMHVKLGDYHVSDIEVAAAFDVDAKKVGADVAEAIFSEPNNTIRFADVPPTGVTVQRGTTLDGLGQFYEDRPAPPLLHRIRYGWIAVTPYWRAMAIRSRSSGSMKWSWSSSPTSS